MERWRKHGTEQPGRQRAAELRSASSTRGTCDHGEAAPLFSSQGHLLRNQDGWGAPSAFWESSVVNRGSDRVFKRAEDFTLLEEWDAEGAGHGGRVE